MKQRINILTLGVNDLKKSMKFYQNGLGWKTKGIIGTEFDIREHKPSQLDGSFRCLGHQ